MKIRKKIEVNNLRTHSTEIKGFVLVGTGTLTVTLGSGNAVRITSISSLETIK